MLILAGVLLLAVVWTAFCTTPLIYWNAPRLAPSFAIAAGLNPYATQASAQHLGWQYGPVFPLAYLPITVFGNLTWSFALATALNLAFYSATAWGIGWWAWQSKRWAWHGTGVALALTLGSGGNFFWLHVDGLALPLELLAVVATVQVVFRSDRQSLHLAAVCVALAFWTKQLAVVLPIALTAWLWWKIGWRGGVKFVGAWLAYIAVLGVGFVALFGAQELWFNLWCI